MVGVEEGGKLVGLKVGGRVHVGKGEGLGLSQARGKGLAPAKVFE